MEKTKDSSVTGLSILVETSTVLLMIDDVKPKLRSGCAKFIEQFLNKVNNYQYIQHFCKHSSEISFTCNSYIIYCKVHKLLIFT
jgi:5,10-methylenetetrahydrofolate reductase